ncbi:TPA: 5-oxoprolinase subunit PxpA [Burkholderia cepacia]
MARIDLNADIGEGFGPWCFGEDEALMRVISSANIACGYHAGDAEIMSDMVDMAAQFDVGIGAHVGFPDMLGFGRRDIAFEPRSFSKHIIYQIGALAALASLRGRKVEHLNFHGALGHMIATHEHLAEATISAVAAYDQNIIISTIPEGETMKAARRHGIRTVGTFFADRAYGDDGKLLSRMLPGSVLTDSDAIAERVITLMEDGVVHTVGGKTLSLDARSVLVHSDTPGAAQHACAIRDAVEQAGGQIAPLAQLV